MKKQNYEIHLSRKLFVATTVAASAIVLGVSPAIANRTGATPQTVAAASYLPADQAWVQNGVLNTDLVGATGYVYKKGTPVASQSRLTDSSDAKKNDFYIDLHLEVGVPSAFGFGFVPDKYITLTTVTKQTNIPQAGVWALYQYIDNADQYIAIDTPYVAPAKIDKSALEAALTQADAVDKPLYTTATLVPFNAAVKNANTVDSNDDATQAEVDTAANELTSAINGLVKDSDIVNKDALKSAMATAQQYVDAGQVSASLKQDLQTYIAAGQNSLDTLSTPQTRVDAQTSKLNELIAQAKAETPVAVDKSALTQAVTAAKSTLVNPAAYTATSSKAAQAALSTAETTAANADATQAQVDATTTALKSAITALVKAADKTALAAELQTAQNAIKAADKYTPASVAPVNAAITAGMKVNANTDATQSQVDEAVATLKTAVAGLTKAPVTDDTDTTTTTQPTTGDTDTATKPVAADTDTKTTQPSTDDTDSTTQPTTGDQGTDAQPSRPAETTSVPVTAQVPAAKSHTATKHSAAKSYPQTGNTQNLTLSLAGIGATIMALFGLAVTRNKHIN
ncbi:LPXTG cell wall anchor domain-containing protein [Lacticaseibacillus sharpeae]|nr:LPXTG cell wall anchor domain-containing protein [Lacticaseibacillus sharpeae]